ncbi:hypothetical protein ACIOWA_01645, partial [Pseudomonas sp. NPDC087614]
HHGVLAPERDREHSIQNQMAALNVGFVDRLQWSRYGRLADLYIPRPRTAHPYPEERFASRT